MGRELGWNEFFAKQIRKDESTQTVARISGVERTRLRAVVGNTEYDGELAGRFFQSGSKDLFAPAVGDWVVAKPLPAEHTLIITRVLERRSHLSRTAASAHQRSRHAAREEQVIAANIDYVFVVVGLDGELNLRRVERYLTAIYAGGATPVLVLNKSDLSTDLVETKSRVRRIAPGVDVIAISAMQGDGIGSLNSYLSPGVTVALAGSSGVGKSTLINQLLGADRVRTGAVRDFDRKGRHTTTWRELIVLPEGGVLIDNPGMREFMAWNASVADAFEDVSELASKCRYRDCSHSREEDCAVRAAVAAGTLPRERWQNYLRLRSEASETEAWMTKEQTDRAFGRKQRDGRRVALRMKGK